MDNVIKVSTDIQQLTGIGTEYLVKDGIILAAFYDGQLRRVGHVDGESETVTAA